MCHTCQIVQESLVLCAHSFRLVRTLLNKIGIIGPSLGKIEYNT